MQDSKYMFLKYTNNFPVCVSVENSKKTLAIAHYHEEAEILKVTRSEVIVGTGTLSLKCYKGDILFFYPNALHQVSALTEESEVKAISYKADMLNFAVDCSFKNGGFCVFKPTDPCYLKLNAAFEEAVELFFQKNSTYELEMTACLLKITAVFINENMVITQGDNSAKNRLEPAFKYIEQNIGSVIRISDLERLLNFSKEHIIRLFKTETGRTPAEYITDFKIKKAMEMLKDNTLSITDISKNLGFANPSHFSKSFKTRLKITPMQYKKSN